MQLAYLSSEDIQTAEKKTIFLFFCDFKFRCEIACENW